MVLKQKNKKNIEKEENPPMDNAENEAVQDDSADGKDNEKKDAAESLQEQLTLEKERVLRLSAEFENYKKRKQREIDDFKKFANETVFKQFLSVVDNLERAIDAAEANEDQKSLLEGVQLTHKEILKVFEQFNVKPVEAENQAFDPNFHQAVTQEESDAVPDNTVTKVLQKGYILHDRLIRPAMVVVSKKATQKTEVTKEN